VFTGGLMGARRASLLPGGEVFAARRSASRRNMKISESMGRAPLGYARMLRRHARSGPKGGPAEELAVTRRGFPTGSTGLGEVGASPSVDKVRPPGTVNHDKCQSCPPAKRRPDAYRGPRVTLGDVRAHGVRRLLIYCSEGLYCHHSGTVDADRWPDETAVRDLSPKAVCTKSGSLALTCDRTGMSEQGGKAWSASNGDTPTVRSADFSPLEDAASIGVLVAK
jgi:hypothetical protein